ncbi:MAG: hypothetical protein IKL49_08040 [Lachnospiraceae bacterium]|nr:hypothetical protein [Lachnospiraceae bacterium]
MGSEKSIDIGDNSKMDLNCEHNSSCFQKMAGILTSEEIVRYGLVDYSPDENPTDRLKPTTFDLTMGEGHFVYSGEGDGKAKKWNLFYIGEDDEMEKLNENHQPSNQYKRQNDVKIRTLSIPPYGAALIQLRETVDTYSVVEKHKKIVVGRFDLKLGSVHKGIISQQATQVEPYYRGKLFCFIYNLSSRVIDIKHGDKIATIEFSYVSCLGDEEVRNETILNLKKMNKKKYQKSYCDTNGIKDIRYFRSQEQYLRNVDC